MIDGTHERANTHEKTNTQEEGSSMPKHQPKAAGCGYKVANQLSNIMFSWLVLLWKPHGKDFAQNQWFKILLSSHGKHTTIDHKIFEVA